MNDHDNITEDEREMLNRHNLIVNCMAATDNRPKNYRVFIKDLDNEPISMEEIMSKMNRYTIRHVNLLGKQ